MPDPDLIKLGESALADPNTPPEARKQVEAKLAELRGTPSLGTASAPKLPEAATAPKPTADVHTETPEEWRARREKAKEQTAPPAAAPQSRYYPHDPQTGEETGSIVPDYYFEPASGPDDAKYRTELDAAKREGRPLVRYKDTSGLEAFGAGMMPYLASAGHSLSRIRTLGAADRIASAMDPQAQHNIENVATQGVDMPGMRPVNIPLLGPTVPFGAGAAALGAGGKATGSAMNAIGKMAGAVGDRVKSAVVDLVGPRVAAAVGLAAAGAVGGGGASLGESGVDATANVATGQPQQGGTLERAAGSAALGVPMAFAMHGAQSLAAKGPQALREGKRGADLVTAEQGGVQTAMFGPGGLKPTPEIRSAQSQQAETGQVAQDISRQNAAESIIPEVARRKEANIARTHGEQAAYENSPAGHETVSAQPVVDKLFELKSRNSIDRTLKNGTTVSEPLAWNDFGKFKKEIPRLAEGKLITPQEAADTDNRVITRAEAREMGIRVYGKGGKDTMVEVVPTQLDPASLEQTIKNVSNVVKEGSATRNRSLAHHEEIAAALRSMRDQLPATGPEGVAPASLTATTKSGKKELSGYSAMKAQQEQRFSHEENVLRSIGLNKDLKSLDPAQHDQMAAVTNALKSRRMSPDEIRNLVASNKGIEKQLRTAMAHQSFDKLTAGSGIHGSVVDAGHGAYGVLRAVLPDAFRFDPAMRAVGNFKESTASRQSAVAGRSAAGTTFLRQNLLDLKAALNPNQDEQGATP